MNQADKTVSKDDEPIITLHKPSSPKSSLTQEDGEREKETGGYEKTVEPTRYGDWEIAGRCIDF